MFKGSILHIHLATVLKYYFNIVQWTIPSKLFANARWFEGWFSWSLPETLGINCMVIIILGEQERVNSANLLIWIFKEVTCCSERVRGVAGVTEVTGVTRVTGMTEVIWATVWLGWSLLIKYMEGGSFYGGISNGDVNQPTGWIICLWKKEGRYLQFSELGKSVWW